MIAVDTNLLVYAQREELPFHTRAREAVESLARGRSRWSIPWPCVHETIGILTNRRVFKTPTSLANAFLYMQSFEALDHCDFLAEAEGHLANLARISSKAKLSGAAIHDARIAAICIGHGVRELWSADRDFSRFAEFTVRNPLVE